MPRVRVVHWKSGEAGPLLEACSRSGFDVDYVDGDGGELARAIRARVPDVVVIDLSRRPSHGQAVAVWLRGIKTTRHIPIVFSGGEPEKVARIREILPDAHYCGLIRQIPAMVKRAAKAGRTMNPVVPAGMMQRGNTKSASQKLGIQASATVAVVEPPRDFPELLGEIPDTVEFESRPAPITLWFVHRMEDLLVSLRQMRAVAGRTKLWILWRKGSGNGLTQNFLRTSAREAGLVDYKICSVDQRWSAMLFTRKKK